MLDMRKAMKLLRERYRRSKRANVRCLGRVGTLRDERQRRPSRDGRALV